VLSWLREDIPSIRDHATNDNVRQTMDDLLPEVDYQEQQFQQVVAAIDSDPDQAEQLAQDGIDRLIDNVYGPMNDQVVTQQQSLMDSINQTTTLMYDTSDQTSTEMESSLNRTDVQMRDLIASTSAEMKATVDDVDTAFQQAILVSLLTVVLFIVAAIVVIAAIMIVAHQIVQPVLKLSDVAVSIENEDYKKDETDLASISVRRDEIGTLARVFDRMAKEVYSRVEKLKQQVAELKIVIDEGKMAAQVSEITDSEYFTDLQTKVKSMRRRKTTETEAVNNPDTPPPSPDTSAS
jgi:HAMP domain-containing protein